MTKTATIPDPPDLRRVGAALGWVAPAPGQAVEPYVPAPGSLRALHQSTLPHTSARPASRQPSAAVNALTALSVRGTSAAYGATSPTWQSRSVDTSAPLSIASYAASSNHGG
jgi:hypothetical protein